MKYSTLNEKQIAFAGSGHGGKVAFKSLSLYFESIEVLTNDNEIQKMLRDEDSLIKSIKDSKSFVVVCAGHLELIPKNILENKIIINTHPSLLPKYRGLHALAWAMLNMEKEIGFTIHLMNENMDDGDILEQFSIKYEKQTSQEIMKMFDNYVEINLGRVVFDFLEKNITPIKQNKDEATWVTRRNLEDCVIDFDKSNKYISAMFRTLVEPYPLPLIRINDNLYEVKSYRLIDIKYEMHIGSVVNIEHNDVYIKTKDGLLVINSLRNFETKKYIIASKIIKIGKRL
jgi:methionyl-tRNA formyltransferase